MTTYWLSDFCSLFNSTNINPFEGDDKNFKFNSLTRLIILVTIVCAIVFSSNSNEIFLGGAISIFLSVVIYMLTYNSAEMSLNVEKQLKSYADAERIIKEQQDELKIGLSKTGEEIIDDYNANVANEVTLDYVPPNTDLSKQKMFLDGNGMPDNVVKTTVNPKDYVSLGNQVTSGTAKKLSSLIGKNLSFT